MFAEIQECPAFSSPKLSDEEDYEVSDASSPSFSVDNLVNNGGDGHEKLFCEHKECNSKSKTSFKTWKNFVRYYTIRISLISAIHGIWTDEPDSQTFNVKNLMGFAALT